MTRILAMLGLAVALATGLGGCAIDDSAPVRSVWRPADGSPSKAEVVYVTDREADPASGGGFSTRWAAKPSCGSAETVVPAAPPQGQDPQWGYVAKTNPATCAKDGRKLGGAIALIEAQAKAKNCRTVLLFVHGFRSGFDGGVVRVAQIAHDTQTACALAAFSWSADINTSRYVADIEHSDYSQPLLAEFLRELSESDLRVTVIGHSLGGRLTLMTLASLGQDRNPPRTGFIDELVLAAADVGAEPDNNDFAKLMVHAVPFAKRTTIYASSYDTALEMSRRVHGNVPRLGAQPAITFMPGDKTHEVDIIDASFAKGDRLDHSYFGQSVEAINDLRQTLLGVPLDQRVKPADASTATLQCGSACTPNYQLKTDGRPRFSTRVLYNLLAALPIIE